MKSWKSHEKWKKVHQTLSFQFFINRSSILMLFILFFSCGLQDFKFWYVNRKAFGASFLYWVDFTVECYCHSKFQAHFFSKLQWLENSLLLQSIWKQELSIPEVLFANYNTHCYADEMVCLYVYCILGITLSNLSSFEFKFDDTYQTFLIMLE